MLQHGTDHRNRAAAGEKKTEYPAAEPADAALKRISRGMATLRPVSGFIPVLAPPWNRMRNDLLDKLPGIGIRGISAYGPQKSREPAPGLRQVNTHVDVVAWRRGRRFVGEEQALSQAIKWLDHRTSPSAGSRTTRCTTRRRGISSNDFSLCKDVRWLSAAEVFSYTAPGAWLTSVVLT